MLSAFSDIRGVSLRGTDDGVGSVRDIFFDGDWMVRYLVVDTGHWLPGRQVLLPPAVLGACDWRAGVASVTLSRQQVKDSPSVEADRPISRQMEIELFRHYEVPYYWGPAAYPLSGGGPPPIPLATQVPVGETYELEKTQADLRSCQEVINYSIEASDGSIGHVENFVIDDDDWGIRYLVVDTKNWLPGRKVIVDPESIEAVSWSEAIVQIALTRDRVKRQPEFDPRQTSPEGYEQQFNSS